MSETKSRRAMTRCYVTADGNVEFRKAGVTDTFDLANLSAEDQVKAMKEGVILLYLRGATFESLLDGSAFPDRSPPKGRETSVAAPKAPKPERQPSAIIMAIAAVKQQEGDGSDTKEDCIAWAKSLTRQQRQAIRAASPAVQFKMAEIRGTDVSLAALVGAGAEETVTLPAEDDLEDAAD